ncbi:hypothetical protein PG994_004678 [Apiospora phragmitis]|uniref:EGF-like domain-containing protein n=1 Tax=Apiospora phragmitis TaxID=2905665 RepID=A0ABR1VR96_9PEZI
MSRAQYANEMDGPSGIAGSVRRARERAEAGLPPDFPQNSSLPLPRRAPQPPARDGIGGLKISRPQPVAPQWPLAGPIPSPTSSEGSDRYKPPPGRSPQPPQRPPRPSRVPSILDASRVQEHTPVFQYLPQNQRTSELSVPDDTPVGSSRPSTLSSVGSIPDFPLPTSAPAVSDGLNIPPPPPPPPPRRSVNLGPPPSSRRGASSFYSTASYVSPIPEESPRARSHTSYASSAAIPESFGTISPGLSPDGAYFDDTIAEESVYSDDDTDERGLERREQGRNADSLAASVTAETETLSVPRPIRRRHWICRSILKLRRPFGRAINDRGNSWLWGNSPNYAGRARGRYSTDPSGLRDISVSPRPAIFSAIRRPPRLDMNAVRDAESRGSLTSLPDLIRRATRLASMIEKGRRPASQFNALDFPPDIYPREYNNARDMEREFSMYDNEKHQSGLSDMLAAFPPPAQAQAQAMPPQPARLSGTSWPLPLGRVSFRGQGQPQGQGLGQGQPQAAIPRDAESPPTGQEKPGRRCCGLPMWGFILLLFILVIIIAAAIIVPLEFFVIRKQNAPGAQPAMETCMNQLTCENGGTNVITQGVCACICSNGFTGSTCTVPGSDGCVTTMLSPNDPALRNVTLGQAIPRLVQGANTNFSIPLSATAILAKFNSANLSCNAENALVTFGGSATRVKGAQDQVTDAGVNPSLQRIGAAAASGFPIVISVSPGVDVTVTLNNPAKPSITTITNPTGLPSDASTVFATTLTVPDSPPPSAPLTTTAPPQTTGTATTTSAPPATTSTVPQFVVTEQVLDFARVAVLFVIQSQNLNNAVMAQMALQKFFSDATSSGSGQGVTPEKAKNLNIGGKNTIDLVHLTVKLDS